MRAPLSARFKPTAFAFQHACIATLCRLVSFWPLGPLPAAHHVPLRSEAGYDAQSGAPRRLAESEAKGRSVLKAEAKPERADKPAKQACLHGGFLHLESFEAGGADPLAAGGRAFLDADLLEVRVPAAARRPQRVAARVAEVGPLPARITNFSHETSPVLGYRSDLGTPENAISKPSPDVGR